MKKEDPYAANSWFPGKLELYSHGISGAVRDPQGSPSSTSDSTKGNLEIKQYA